MFLRRKKRECNAPLINAEINFSILGLMPINCYCNKEEYQAPKFGPWKRHSITVGAPGGWYSSTRKFWNYFRKSFIWYSNEPYRKCRIKRQKAPGYSRISHTTPDINQEWRQSDSSHFSCGGLPVCFFFPLVVRPFNFFFWIKEFKRETSHVVGYSYLGLVNTLRLVRVTGLVIGPYV